MKNLLRSILLLALWVVLSLMPVTANAEEGNLIELTQDTYKSHLDLGSYNKYYLPSGSYILMGDITLDDTLLIGCEGQFNDVDFSDVNVTLDLNGYVLRQGNNQEFPVIQVYQGSTLTIQDSRPDAIHKFTADGTGLWHLDEENGDKTVNGGVITGAVKTGLVLQAVDMNKDAYIARCTMNGGNIVGCTYSSYGGGVCERQSRIYDEWRQHPRLYCDGYATWIWRRCVCGERHIYDERRHDQRLCLSYYRRWRRTVYG